MKTEEHVLYRPFRGIRGFVLAYRAKNRRVIALAEDADQAEVNEIVKWARRRRGKFVFDAYPRWPGRERNSSEKK